MERVILHCDLNNFYASVECLYNPDIRDFPVAVCGSQEERHGIVLAKNMLAKKAGVKTAEAIWQARKKCPGLVIVKPNYKLYLRFSQLARDIYKDYTNLIESFGIDECWLDITGNVKSFEDGEKIANEIRERIKDELGVTVSVGVSYNKIFAKLGSDMKKPDAVTVISKQNFKYSVWNLPTEELLYVGRATQKKLNKVGIYTIGDLARAPMDFVRRQLGKWGETLWGFANGLDTTPVTNVSYEPTAKGIGNSLTTPKDLTCNEEVKMLLYVLSESVGERMRRANLKGKTVQISIKDCDLSYIERQGKLTEVTYASTTIAEKAFEIFLRHWTWSKNIRALGVRVTDLGFADEFVQISLLGDTKKQKREEIDKCVDRLRSRFGHYSVQRALMLKDSDLNANPVEENVIHPVAYFKGE